MTLDAVAFFWSLPQRELTVKGCLPAAYSATGAMITSFLKDDKINIVLHNISRMSPVSSFEFKRVIYQQKVVCLRIAEHCNYGKYDIAKTTGKINKQRKKVCFTDQKEDVGSNCFEWKVHWRKAKFQGDDSISFTELMGLLVPCGRSKVHLFFGGQWLLILYCWWLSC